MASLDEKREARLSKLIYQREKAEKLRREREARQSARKAQAEARALVRRMKKTPGDYLGSWQRPPVGEPPASSLRCSSCLQLFANRACFEAHRVHFGTTIERCALGFELGACQWERSASGVWKFGIRISLSEDSAGRARMNLERLASVRQERERFDFGLDPKLNFPARPALPLTGTAGVNECEQPLSREPIFTEGSEQG
jgi:hypothetical protein